MSFRSCLGKFSYNAQVNALNFLLGITVGLIVTALFPSTMEYFGQWIVMRDGSSGVTPMMETTTGPPRAALHQPMVTRGPVRRSQDEETVHIKFQDELHHHDDSRKANEMAGKIRVLCWIMTHPKNHASFAHAVKLTWGRRCNLLLFMSEEEDPDLPSIKLTVGSGRQHLTAKTMHAFDYVYKNHRDDYDWFLKADDDTYVIVENMRYMLSAHSPSEEVYFGHHFYSETWHDMYQGYFSGGGGYVLSRAALDKFGQRPKGLCAEDKGSEDVEMGYCMERLNVTTGDSRDALGRSRFHCFGPETHLKGNYPKWYLTFDKYGAPWGMGNISDYAISFHYVKPQKMYSLEYYVYHLRPYGIASGSQNLNKVHR